MVWFGRNSEAEFKTMNDKGGHRAARAAKNIDIYLDIDMASPENIDIDIDKDILENIDIDKGILQNIDIDKISYR